MLRYLFFLFLLFLPFLAEAQENNLVYLKINPANSRKFVPFGDGSGYVLTYDWPSQSNSINIDIGVWTDSLQSTFIDSVYYGRGVVVYNSDFEIEGVMLHSWSVNPDLYPISMDQTILNFNKQAYANDSPDFPAIPYIAEYPSTTYGQSVFIDYNSVSETNSGLMNLSSPVLSYSQIAPYNGYFDAVYGFLPPSAYNKPAAIIGDSILVSYLNLFHTQTLNETESFTNWGGQVNMIRTQQDLQTNDLLTGQIGSAEGNLATFFLEPSKDSLALFRAGLVRGNNTSISVSGAQVEMPPNDSLYHVFITKETVTGETQWLTELYAYNNILADTLNTSGTQFRTGNNVFSILEKNDYLYVSSEFKSMAVINDTLLYRNFLGQSGLFANFIPNYGYTSDIAQVAFTESRIYKLDENGNIKGKLGYANSLVSYESNFNSGGSRQPNYLFEVSNKIAWVHSYYAVGDTTIQFTYIGADGNEQITPIEFPAGQGSYILWLDYNLNILDHWLIPFQNSTINGMAINAVIPYNADTLLIQGVLYLNTTIDFNPFGDSEIFTAENLSSFFAFYSAPEILTSTKTSKKPASFKIYPNPVSGSLRVSGINSSSTHYIIYDLSGRGLSEGRFSPNEVIPVSNLNSGMYILWIDSDIGGDTAKFIVQ